MRHLNPDFESDPRKTRTSDLRFRKATQPPEGLGLAARFAQVQPGSQELVHNRYTTKGPRANVVRIRGRWRPRFTTLERFEQKCSPEPTSGCILWDGAFDPKNGYGNFQFSAGEFDKAHRAAWRLYRGPIPKGIVVRHYICDNTACVNVVHLRLGTTQDNSDDCARKGRKRNGRSPGEANGRAKLTAEQAREVCVIAAAGLRTCADIGREYGIQGATVASIRDGRLWAPYTADLRRLAAPQTAGAGR